MNRTLLTHWLALIPETWIRGGNGFSVAFLLCLAVVSVADAAIPSPQASESESTRRPGDPEDLIAILGEDRARYWGHANKIIASADSQRVFVIEAFGHVSAFDSETLQRVLRFRPHEERCLDMALLDSQTKLVTISTDGTVALWDVTKDEPVELDRVTLLPGETGTKWMALSSGSRSNRIAAYSFCSGDHTAKESLIVLEVVGGKLVRGNRLPAARHFAISSTGRWLVSCEESLGGDSVQIGQKNGHFSFSYKNANLVVRDLDKSPPQIVGRTPRKTVENMVFAPNDSLWAYDPFFVSKRQEHSWRLQDGQLVGHDANPSVWQAIRGFSADGKFSAINQGSNLVVSDVATKVPDAKIETLTSGGAVAFLKNRSIIVATAPTLQRWDWNGKEYTSRLNLTGHQARVEGLIFDPQSNSLLTSGDGVREWPLADLAANTTNLSSQFLDTKT